MQINLTPFPILYTDRLLLRRLNSNDRDDIMQIRSDEQVNKHLDREGPITAAQAEAFIQRIDEVIKDETGVYWAISLRNKPALIGTICYWNVVAEKDRAEIGYELLPAYHGKGLMQEAITKVISYGFEEMKLKVITALPYAGNTASVKLLKRNNFTLDTAYQFVNKGDAEGYEVYVRIANL